jgi:hypothetical protein
VRSTFRPCGRECERAKVSLSAETAVDLQVDGEAVRMVRGDIEQLSARSSPASWTPSHRADLSERDGSPLRMILLLGGAADAPSLVEAASVRFEVPSSRCRGSARSSPSRSASRPAEQRRR